MADRRINIDKIQDAFIEKLLDSNEGIGPFAIKADVMAFAASYGAMLDASKKLGETTKSPIRKDVFDSHNYGNLFDLLAVFKTGDSKVLDSSEEAQNLRAQIFEEYAKGGLERMVQDSKGSVDLTDYVLSLVAKHRNDKNTKNAGGPLGLDLTELLEE